MHIDCLPCIFEHINRLWILYHSSQHQLILNKYIVSKFNVNIKLKLSVGWLKYVDIIKSNNNRVGKTMFLHIIPINIFFDAWMSNFNIYILPKLGLEHIRPLGDTKCYSMVTLD